MKRAGWLALAVAASLAIAACGSSGGSDGGLGGKKSTTSAKADACKAATALEASETGITPTEIKVTVMADVGSPLSLGLFQGSMDGVHAWADYVNQELGGLACRKVVVQEADSKLSPDEAKNGITTACGSSVVLLGTSALFLNDMRPVEGCKDKAGVATGLPDLPVLQTEPVEQCSKISFAVIPNGGSCPYTKGVRSFKSVTPAIEWFKKNVTDGLHGVFVVPQDLPSTITASTPIFTAIQQDGVKQDAQFGASGLFTQSQYTPIVQSIKSHNSTWVMNGLDFAGTVKMRKEAAAQGVNSVKVWACSLQCYAPGFIKQGGAAVEGQYAWLQILPFEDKGSNDMLDAFLKYDAKPDAFGLQAFSAGLLFQQVVEAIVAKDGPNGVTRKAILDQVRTVHDFDAGGLIVKTDVAGKTPSPCIAIVQVENGTWVRKDPVEKGKFDCDQPSAITNVTLDPLKAFKPA